MVVERSEQGDAPGLLRPIVPQASVRADQPPLRTSLPRLTIQKEPPPWGRIPF